MNTARKGNAAERCVARYQQDHGWIVASRRHIGGAGDLLCVHTVSGACWLIEVKACNPKQLWQNFRREDRVEMLEQALPPGGKRFVVNVLNVKREEFDWRDERHWP